MKLNFKVQYRGDKTIQLRANRRVGIVERRMNKRLYFTLHLCGSMSVRAIATRKLSAEVCWWEVIAGCFCLDLE
jgi:hypothetical protein